jgi:hypothetical protein
MQIASQHAEAVGERSGICMEEWFFFYRVTLHSANVAPRHVEGSGPVETDFADSSLTFWNGTAMSTGVAANAIAIDGFVEFAFADVLIEDFAEGGHRSQPLLLF